MTEVRLATHEDALRVLANPSDATVLDVKSLNLQPKEVLRFYLSRVPERDAFAFVEDGEVVALLGWDKMYDPQWFSWTLTTPKALDPNNRAPLMAARDVMRRLDRENAGVQLLSIVTSAADDVSRWMRCLGFRHIPQEPNNLWCYVGVTT